MLNWLKTVATAKGRKQVRLCLIVILAANVCSFVQADRDLCMRLLLRVKGVVSVTFDVGKKQCLLRTRPDVKPEVGH